MDKELWNHQYWVLNHPYPKGIHRILGFIILSTISLLVTIYYFKYPIYHTFYGYVNKTNNNIVTIMIPIDEIEEFQSSVENESLKLQKVEKEIQSINGKNVMIADVIVSMKKQILVENNIVSIRVKTKDVSIYEELSQKWKRGINNERNDTNQTK